MCDHQSNYLSVSDDEEILVCYKLLKKIKLGLLSSEGDDIKLL